MGYGAGNQHHLRVGVQNPCGTGKAEAWPSCRTQGVRTLQFHFWDFLGRGPTCYPKSQTWIQIPAFPTVLRPSKQMRELMFGLKYGRKDKKQEVA